MKHRRVILPLATLLWAGVACERSTDSTAATGGDMEEKSTLLLGDRLSLRFAVAGMHAEAFLECARGSVGKVAGESKDPNSSIRVMDIAIPLKVGPVGVIISLHALKATLYPRDAQGLSLYGGLVALAGPADGPSLWSFAADMLAAERPVWSVKVGRALQLSDASLLSTESGFSCEGNEVRSLLKELTKRSIRRLEAATPSVGSQTAGGQ